MSRIVLVADDSMTIQRMAAELLAGQGLEVVTVANGVAAIKKLATVKPLMVLADVDMPGRDGYEVCDFVKKSAELRDVPVILAFSDTDPYDEGRAADVRADAVVKKPFVKAELLARVQELAGKPPAHDPSDSESYSAHSTSEPHGQDFIAQPMEATFTSSPAEPASVAGLLEGAGLSEPEAAAATPEPATAALFETVEELADQTKTPEPGMPQQFDTGREAEFSVSGEFPQQTAMAGGEPKETTFSFTPVAVAGDESQPSFVGVVESRGTGGNEDAPPEFTDGENQSPFILSLPAGITAGTGEVEASAVIATLDAQEANMAPNLAEMSDLTQPPAAAESVLEIARGEIPGAQSSGAGPASPPVEHATKSLGEWKLEATLPASPHDTGTETPLLAVLPDVAAQFPLPAAAEKIDHPILTPWQAPDVSSTEQSVDLEPREVAALPEAGETSSCGQFDSPQGQERPLEKMEDAGPCEAPPDIREPEVIERVTADTEPEHPSVFSLADSDNSTAEPALAAEPVAPASVPCDSAENASPVSAESAPSWELPSEAALNQAFLDAALSSIGLLHASTPQHAADQPILPAAVPDEATNPPEGHYPPAPLDARPAEPAAVGAAPPRTIDRTVAESIVERVVVRMSPSALSPEMIAQMVQKLTAECLENLGPDRL